MSKRSTRNPHCLNIITPEPWQSWGSTLRYMIVRLAQAISGALLLWGPQNRR